MPITWGGGGAGVSLLCELLYLILMMIYEVDSVLASFQIRNLRIREVKYIAKKITLYVENLTTPIRWN